MNGWESNMVEALLYERSTGQKFEAAWEAAIEVYPPSARAGRSELKLLEDDGQPPDCSLVDFFYGACRQAWHGTSSPLLADMRGLLGMMDDNLDHSTFAHRTSRLRRAA